MAVWDYCPAALSSSVATSTEACSTTDALGSETFALSGSEPRPKRGSGFNVVTKDTTNQVMRKTEQRETKSDDFIKRKGLSKML
jgi:hypothetical protein